MSIQAHDVSKSFYIKNKTNRKVFADFFRPMYEEKNAVKNVSFDIANGEFVGLIGVNGAGKSTTLKMVSGILTPSQGDITVNGVVPYKNRLENAKRIGVVFGQRSQLLWDLPVSDSFYVRKKIYRIDDSAFQKNYSILDEVLGLREFAAQPARQLSLGQKMRANIGLAFIHMPEVVILDEPTIGLDILAKDNIRAFLRFLKSLYSCTVILTTHDLYDVDSLCDRIIMLDKGEVIYDGAKAKFVSGLSETSIIEVEFAEDTIEVDDNRFEKVSETGSLKKYSFSNKEIGSEEAIKLIVNKTRVVNIKVERDSVEIAARKLIEGRAHDV